MSYIISFTLMFNSALTNLKGRGNVAAPHVQNNYLRENIL